MNGGTAGASAGASAGAASGGSGGASAEPRVALDAGVRYQILRLRVAGSDQCLTFAADGARFADCGGEGQRARVQILSGEYLALIDAASGKCVTADGTGLVLRACENGPAQQWAYAGSVAAGYQLLSFSQNQPISASGKLTQPAASLVVTVVEKADALAVVVDERALGWATMPADIIVPDDAPPNGDEATRKVAGTTGGGTWEAARDKAWANVFWFSPSDFSAESREASAKRLASAASGNDPRILLFEAGDYDFSLASPKAVNSCTATCSNGSTYTEVDGFCDCSKVSCKIGGYKDATRTIDLGSNKTLLGLGSGATFRHLMMRAVRNNNLIVRNLAFRQLPGDVRAWDDALLFYPADHVWLDHLSFSGFGRGSVVLSGTRVNSGDSFYAYRDAGWMTFSWLAVDSSEAWRCGGSEDSPYPFFTTNDPALTFEHTLFQHGHGRNPAIDGEGAHFINCSWSQVTDGLDGRGQAKLLVEGSYFDGNNPIRMDDPKPPTVLAPWDAAKLSDKRRQNIFSDKAWASIVSDWGGRKLDLATLNTNQVSTPSYPYGLDPDPNNTQKTVSAGAGVSKGGFPDCKLGTADATTYSCR
jgi:pectate lyase